MRPRMQALQFFGDLINSGDIDDTFRPNARNGVEDAVPNAQKVEVLPGG